jgi:phage-related protein
MVLTDHIRQGATRKRAQRIRQAQFGDGYSQEVADGINSTLDEWANVGWDSLSSTDLTTARAMLDAVGCIDYITWTPPGEATQKRFKVTKDGYTETHPSGALTSVSFNLRQIP